MGHGLCSREVTENSMDLRPREMMWFSKLPRWTAGSLDVQMRPFNGAGWPGCNLSFSSRFQVSGGAASCHSGLLFTSLLLSARVEFQFSVEVS